MHAAIRSTRPTSREQAPGGRRSGRTAAARARLERDREEAVHRKAVMQEALEQHVPDDLLLVTSPPLRVEVVELAQQVQGRGHQQVQPDVVLRHINRWTAKSLPPPELGPAPFYLGAQRKSDREYLIHTAVVRGRNLDHG